MGSAMLMLGFFVCILPLVLLFICYHYCILRDPGRKIPVGNNLVSPSDGKILEIEDVLDYTVITISVSWLNVQTNRMPADGKLIRLNRTHKGMAMTLVTGSGQISLRHRTLMDLNTKLSYGKGERYGHFTLGGKVKLSLPKNVHLIIKEGQRVAGGKTVLGTFSGS